MVVPAVLPLPEDEGRRLAPGLALQRGGATLDHYVRAPEYVFHILSHGFTCVHTGGLDVLDRGITTWPHTPLSILMATIYYHGY